MSQGGQCYTLAMFQSIFAQFVSSIFVSSIFVSSIFVSSIFVSSSLQQIGQISAAAAAPRRNQPSLGNSLRFAILSN